jgi:UDP-glucose 4-epimerase
MQETLIIVGKNSYIGNRLTEYTIAHGMSTIALSSQECNFLELSEVRNFFGSLGEGPYTVLFSAVVNKSVDNSFQSYVRNVEIIKNLMDGHKLAHIDSIIYFSSVDVYGRKPSLPITEESKVNPDDWYGLAKYICEWMLRCSGEVTCPVTILRLPGIYGRSPKDQSVIGRMVSEIRGKKRVVITGKGEVLRDYVFIDDLCRLVLLLIPLKHHGVLNVATGESRSVLDIAETIGRVLQTDFEFIYEPVDEEREFSLTFDNHALHSLIPTFEFTEMADGVRLYL